MIDARGSEGGYSLIEVLIAISVFSLMSVGFYQVLFSQAEGADTIRAHAAIGEEARLGLGRMVRDVREADSLTSASTTSFTVRVNFNGDAYYQNPNPLGDDEVLTYAYDAAAGNITMNGHVLVRNVRPTGTPAEGVFDFSSNYLDYDWNRNGTTTWQELDAAPDHGVTGVGDSDDTLDGPELPYVTSVSFGLRIGTSTRYSDFSATAQMRNRV